MVASKQADKKTIPGFSQGVRVNASTKMVKMVQPICPNSKIEMERTPEGRLIPKLEQDPHRQNCQMDRGADQEARIGWWDDCEARGHNPYFTDRPWYERVEVTNDDGTVDFKTVKHQGTNCKVCSRDHTYPNVVQVAGHVRVNGGQGPKFKKEHHGFKFLPEIGYKDVCYYRNCQKEPKFNSRAGLFCTREHAALVAADLQNIMLVQVTGRFEAGHEQEVGQKRQRGLMEASQFAEIQPIQ